MSSFNMSVLLTVLCAIFVSASTRKLNYSDLEALGVNCPERDRCRGYRNNKDYLSRNCECDSQCVEYRDCCIDAPTSSSATPKTNVRCLHYGKQPYTGVFVIAKCRNDWHGPREVQEKCMGPLNMSDPVSSAPATDKSRRITYRNLYCAECNYANLTSLTTFSFGLSCDSLQDMPKKDVLKDITYDSQKDLWGIYRLNSETRETEFFGCDIHYDVPSYLNSSVRFCRPSLISTCAPDWIRNAVRRACSEYMAVAYDNKVAYRNPHCAICNRKTVDDISCRTEVLSRRRPTSFAELVFNIDQSNSDEVDPDIPECPSGRKYDPFFKRCRRLVCALPGYVMVEGRCVRR